MADVEIKKSTIVAVKMESTVAQLQRKLGVDFPTIGKGESEKLIVDPALSARIHRDPGCAKGFRLLMRACRAHESSTAPYRPVKRAASIKIPAGGKSPAKKSSSSDEKA